MTPGDVAAEAVTDELAPTAAANATTAAATHRRYVIRGLNV
jgi:hypothetical protein